ncbi:MAG: CapA family protein [Cyanobacteria bacterium P01_C01_bin.89]
MNSAASFGRFPWFNSASGAPAVNPRAIARGFDRYLAPHGIRTQALHQGDGCLQLVVECQTMPERERLVQFMLHRLKQLNVAAIAGVKIIARLSGGSDDLWDHSVSFMPPVPQPLVRPTAPPRQMPPPPPPNPAMANRAVYPDAALGAQSPSPQSPNPLTTFADSLVAEAKAAKASVSSQANRYYRRWATVKNERRTSRRMAEFVDGIERRWRQMTSAAGQAVGQFTDKRAFAEEEGGRSPEVQSPLGKSAGRKRVSLNDIAQCLEPLALERGWQVRVGQMGGRMVAVTVDCAMVPRMASEMTEFRQSITQAVCKRLWALNAPNIRGVRLGIREVGQESLAWEQTIRLATPASRSPMAQLSQGFTGIGALRDPVWDRITRSLLLGGAAIVPFVLALWLAQQLPNLTESSDRTRTVTGSGTTTREQTEQVISFRPAALPLQNNFAQAQERRSPVVSTALEVVPATSHPAVTPSDETVTLLFGGDVTLSNFFETKVRGDYGKTFAKMPEYAQADVSMVNLENPLTTANTRRPGKSFNFKAKPESVEVLTSGGVDIVTLGNNHAMDYQGKGLSETMEHLEKAGIYAVGAGRDLKEARRPKIVDVKGKRIAYFGYYNAYWHAATDGAPGTNPRDFDAIKADIEAVRDQVDWIVVNYHWGEENAHYPAGYQRNLAQFTIDHGADLIVGHHPHVLQGAEVYKGKAIIYSLGNFIFGGNSRRNYVTAALQVSLTGDEMKLDFLPLVVQDYQPEILPGDRGESIFNHLKHISRNFAEPLLSGTTLKVPKADKQGSEAVAIAPEKVPVDPPKGNVPQGQEATEKTSDQAKLETREPETRVSRTVSRTVSKTGDALTTEGGTTGKIAAETHAEPLEAALTLKAGAPTSQAARGFDQARNHLSKSQVDLAGQLAAIRQSEANSADVEQGSPVPASPPIASQLASETQRQLGQTLAKAKAQLERQQSIAIAAEIEADETLSGSDWRKVDIEPLFSTGQFTAGDRPSPPEVVAEQGEPSADQQQNGGRTQKNRAPSLPFEVPQEPSFAIADNDRSKSSDSSVFNRAGSAKSGGDRLRPLVNEGRPPLLPFIEGAVQRAEASFW